MAYPAKTSRTAIISLALQIIEREGTEALGMRVLARRLGLAPRALYYYFPNRSSMEAAIAAAGIKMLCRSLRQAATETTLSGTLKRWAKLHLRFAREHRSLYAFTFRKHPNAPEFDAAVVTLLALINKTFGRFLPTEVLSRSIFTGSALILGMFMLEELDWPRASDESRESLLAFSTDTLIIGLLAALPPSHPATEGEACRRCTHWCSQNASLLAHISPRLF